MTILLITTYMMAHWPGAYSENIFSSAFVDIRFNPSVTTKRFQQYIVPLFQKLTPLTDSI